jgi:hypothetical protein
MYRLISMLCFDSVILLFLQCDWNVFVRKVADPQLHYDTREDVDWPQLNFDTREDVDWPAWFERMSSKGNTSDPKETGRAIIAAKKVKEAEEVKKRSGEAKKRSKEAAKKNKTGGDMSDENQISTEATQKPNPRRSPRKTKTKGITDHGQGVGDALEQHQVDVVMAVTSPQRSSNDGFSDDEVNEAATMASSKHQLLRHSGDGSTKNRTKNQNPKSSSTREDDEYEFSDAGSSEVEALFTKAPSNGTRKSPAGRKVKAASPAVSSSSISRESSVQSIPAHRAENDSIALFTHCIEATHDIVPVMNGPKPRPFMYWPRHKDYLCTMMLIKRYPNLCEMAETHYGSVQLMAKKWAVAVRTKANNERAIQIRYLKMIWLSNKSKFALALNALDTELEVDNAREITPSLSVQASGINSIAELRDLLKSSEMYNNAPVFNLFCLGLESGMLKMARTMQPARIEKLIITIAHEAHFRLELWLALSKQGFRHKTTGAWTDKRKEYWDEFCQLVAKDRKDNSDTACNNRLGEMHEDNAQSSEEDDDDKEGLNPEYF